MPRVSLSYLFTPEVTGRITVSRGYSPPTTEEISAIGSRDLQPESGWNYEAGVRATTRNARAYIDVAAFYYRMQNAIVRRVDSLGNDYYVNAGGVRQKGLEVQGSFWIVEPKKHRFLRGLKWTEAYTFSNFKFTDYIVAQKEYSGNQVTGVPQHMLVSGLQFLLPSKLSLYVQHTYTSSIPLDDASTYFADSYHLLQANISWQLPLRMRFPVSVYAGAYNLLNVSYSLGNDLNAVGNRFYNPAPGRNYFAGISMKL
jgi:iron complex outermembrane receptor protein